MTNEFELKQLKLTFHHFSSGDLYKGMPLATSVELKNEYNFEKREEYWVKVVSHTYVSLEESHKDSTDTYEEKIDGNIIKELETYDLRNLKNNYFTDRNPERFTHWEIEYNYYFKIVGTYDQELEEIKKISEILNFKQIIEEETNKIKEKVKKLNSKEY